MRSGRIVTALLIVGFGCAYFASRSPRPKTFGNTERPERAIASAPKSENPIGGVPNEETASIEPATTSNPNSKSIGAKGLSPESERAIAAIKRLDACYTSKCHYPESYPREYGFAVGRDIKGSVLELTKNVARENEVAPELSALARESLANDDGHVKEAGLALVATQPPSLENLTAVLNGVIDDIDARLISQALVELGRYNAPADRELIRARLGAALITGSPFISEAISKGLGAFIDSTNLAYFDDLASRARPGSAVAINIRALINDYRRRVKGA